MEFTKKDIEKKFRQDIEAAGFLVIMLPQYVRKPDECVVCVRLETMDQVELMKQKTTLLCDTVLCGRDIYLRPTMSQLKENLTKKASFSVGSSHQPLKFSSTTKWEVIDSTEVQETQAMEVPNGVLIRHTDKRFVPPVASMTHVPFVSIEDIKNQLKSNK